MARLGDASKGTDLLPPPRTWLARFRRELDISQWELAEATGISERVLQRLESGAYENPPVRYLISAATALGLDDWKLLLEDAWLEPLPGTRQLPPGLYARKSHAADSGSR